jgi:hypothetical protein
MNDNQLIGAVTDLPNDDYHAHPAIGASGLKRFAVTPLHYWADYLDPERERKDKRAFRVGRAWHCAVLEPEAFAGRYVADHGVNKLTTRAKVLAELLALPAAEAGTELLRMKGVPDDIKATTKEGKALYAEIEAAGQRPMPETDLGWITAESARMHGKDVLAADDTTRVLKMAAFARALPISRVVFDQMAEFGAAETSLFWRDPASGVYLKVRPDYMLMPCPAFPDGLIIDGKSTTDASVEGFGRTVWNLDYGLQAALYTQVFQQVFKTAGRPPFLWLAQEKESPHAARYFGADDGLLTYWDKRIAALLPRVASCQSTNYWPGYPETVETLALPAYAEKQISEAA